MLPNPFLNAEEQAEILAAQLEDQAAHLPTLEDAQRHAQAQANTQRCKTGAAGPVAGRQLRHHQKIGARRQQGRNMK